MFYEESQVVRCWVFRHVCGTRDSYCLLGRRRQVGRFPHAGYNGERWLVCSVMAALLRASSCGERRQFVPRFTQKKNNANAQHAVQPSAHRKQTTRERWNIQAKQELIFNEKYGGRSRLCYLPQERALFEETRDQGEILKKISEVHTDCRKSPGLWHCLQNESHPPLCLPSPETSTPLACGDYSTYMYTTVQHDTTTVVELLRRV